MRHCGGGGGGGSSFGEMGKRKTIAHTQDILQAYCNPEKKKVESVGINFIPRILYGRIEQER